MKAYFRPAEAGLARLDMSGTVPAEIIPEAFYVAVQAGVTPVGAVLVVVK